MERAHYKVTLFHHTIADGFTKDETIFTTDTLRAAKAKASEWANRLICQLQPFTTRWFKCSDELWRKTGNPRSPEAPNLNLEIIGKPKNQ